MTFDGSQVSWTWHHNNPFGASSFSRNNTVAARPLSGGVELVALICYSSYVAKM